jgi:hypothetical protein
MIRLTVPEIAHLLARHTARPGPPGHAEHWPAHVASPKHDPAAMTTFREPITEHGRAFRRHPAPRSVVVVKGG